MSGWHVGIDVGGTFTDLVAVNKADARHIHLKVSTVPTDPASGFMEAISELRRRTGIAASDIESIFHGTTLATNAIIERRLSKTALVTTRGFGDVIEIGRHWRPHLYDLDAYRAPPLVERRLRFEADERIGADGSIVKELDEKSIKAVLAELDAADVESVGVVFLHSYANPAHEEAFAARLREATGGRIYVSASAELSREPREYERTSTTVLNASLMRLIDQYLTRLEKSLVDAGARAQLYITHSNGGALAPASARRRPVALAQSGPVAGVQACVQIGEELGYPNLVGFDIGGTSTDIAIIENGKPRVVNELDVGGVPVRLQAVQLYSIGAGGGSIASVDEVGALNVGPKSAGANPGPACYDRGGTLPTVTDAHCIIGRLPQQRKLGGFLSMNRDAARGAIAGRVGEPLALSTENAAQAVIDVINAKMEGAVRVLLRERGNDPRDFALVAFGGAGPLHAVELAARLGMSTVIVPQYPGTFSAFGLLNSDLRHDFALSRPVRSDDPDGPARLKDGFAELDALAAAQLSADEGFSRSHSRREYSCDVRYLGQAYEVTVPWSGDPGSRASLDMLREAFHREHKRIYSFSEPNDPCEIRTLRLSVTVPVGSRAEGTSVPGSDSMESSTCELLIDGKVATCPAFERASLKPGDAITAPCLILQDDATTYVPPNVRITVTPSLAIVLSDIPAT